MPRSLVVSGTTYNVADGTVGEYTGWDQVTLWMVAVTNFLSGNLVTVAGANTFTNNNIFTQLLTAQGGISQLSQYTTGFTGTDTLTSTSKRIRIYNPTAGTGIVKMPNATTLSAGDCWFIENQSTAYPIAVQNTGGSVITDPINSVTTAACYGRLAMVLTDNSTANGTWYVAKTLSAAQNLADIGSASTALANLGGMAKSANLSDVSNTATALTNLGITNANAILPVLPNRNVLINGGMTIDQLNSGASQTITAGAALAYTVDQWWAACTGANVTGQQTAITGWPFAMKRAYQFTGLASNTGVQFGQRMEMINTYHLAGQSVSLSAYMKASTTKTVTWTAYYATTDDTFGTLASPTKTQIATGTWSVTTTPTRFNATFTGPSEVNSHGIEIVFSVPTLIGSETWAITGVQFEIGTVATAFEMRPYTIELQLCQRYFFQGSVGMVGFTSGNTQYFSGKFPVEMRIAPTAFTVVSYGTVTTPGSAYSLTGVGVSPYIYKTFFTSWGLTTALSMGSGQAVIEQSAQTVFRATGAQL